ncbi:MAG TPA: hypothetical protein VFX60_17680 [Micromonospora sp.]|nr:hypothetical protein [Micromonospora sp.]
MRISAPAAASYDDRHVRRRAGSIAALQMILGGLCTLQLLLYLTRSTPLAERISINPANTAVWRIPMGAVGGIGWYLIAYAAPLALLLGLTGAVTLFRRRAQLSSVHTWMLAIGTAVCVLILAVALTPFGQDLRIWWLD